MISKTLEVSLTSSNFSLQAFSLRMFTDKLYTMPEKVERRLVQNIHEGYLEATISGLFHFLQHNCCICRPTTHHSFGAFLSEKSMKAVSDGEVICPFRTIKCCSQSCCPNISHIACMQTVLTLARQHQPL